MEFKLNHNPIRIKNRQRIIATVFIIIITIIGAVGIIGPEPNMMRIIISLIFISFFFFLLRSIQIDFNKTKQKLLNHRLIIENDKLVLTHDALRMEIDFQRISSVRFKHKKGAVESIVVDVEKDTGFTLKDYENMNAIKDVLSNSLPSSKIIEKT